MATAPTRRPSLLVNGLPSVSENERSANISPNSLKQPQQAQQQRTTLAMPAGSGSAPASSSISPQRDAAKLNMLRRMRPPPFQYAWTLYHDKNLAEGTSQLTTMLENIITLKPFWEAYNRLPLDALKMKDSVHFFKRGVKPRWEDPRNVKGGAWTFRVSRDKSQETWKEMLLLAVGEQFADVIQPRDDLCGLSFSARFNSNLITIWNRDGNAKGTIDGILNVVLTKLSPELVPSSDRYYYKLHSEHKGYDEALQVKRAEDEALISGKIEEAKVREGEVERQEEEERLREEEERTRARSQTIS